MTSREKYTIKIKVKSKKTMSTVTVFMYYVQCVFVCQCHQPIFYNETQACHQNGESEELQKLCVHVPTALPKYSVEIYKCANASELVS